MDLSKEDRVIKSITKFLYREISDDGIKRGLHERQILLYDDSGCMIEKSIYKPNGALIASYKYKYDNYGNKVEKCKYDPEGTLIETHSYGYKYDDNGSVVEKNKYDDTGKLKSTKYYKYEYDDKGNKLRGERYRSSGSDKIVIEKYEYLNRGNLSSKTRYSFADWERNLTFFYFYEYDKMGNWTQLIISVVDDCDEEDSKIIVREIECAEAIDNSDEGTFIDDWK